MKPLLFALVLSVLTGFLITCSESGTGPDLENEGENEQETPTYNVNVDTTPVEGGSVSPTDTTVKAGEQLTLQTDASDEYLFTHWSGDIDSTADNPLSVTVDQDYTLNANFEIKSYKLTINTDGEGTVDETVLKQKSKEYEHGTVVELSAEPDEGWKFVEWQADVTGSENPAQVTVDESNEVTAVFEKKSFGLTVEISGDGSVSLNPDQDEYEEGTQVELTASATGDWAFDKWEGDVTGNTNPITITMDANKSITALFENNLFAGGAGTEDKPYKISTVVQLQDINQFPSVHYIQINDIDASATDNWNGGKGFDPIGDEILPFSGSYDGQEYEIRNLSLKPGADSYEDYFGLFGYGESPKISNIALESIAIIGRNDDYIGGIIGYIEDGNITNSSVTGDIVGDLGENIGGLVGFSTNGILKKSYSKVTINGFNSIGGLIGFNK